MVVAAACSKYDSPDNLHYEDYGTAYTYDGNPAADYYIVRDDGVTLYIKSNQLLGKYTAKDGQRVKCNYEILTTNPETRSQSVVEHEIKLYSISDVLKKDPVWQDFVDEDFEKRRDSIGNDPLVKVKKMFYSGKFVNVEFTYLRQANLEKPITHLITLVVDDADEKGVVKARIYHNANGDLPSGNEGSFAIHEYEMSFDLSSVIPEGQESVMIEFEWQERGRQETSVARKLFTRNPTGNTLIVGSWNGDGTLYHYSDEMR